MNTHELIAHIEAAFAGVERGNGVTIHEAREIDRHSSRAERIAARALDTECSWQDVPSEALRRNDQYLVFLDAEGMRFYLPALMLQYLRGDEAVGDELVAALCVRNAPDKTFDILNGEQSHAVWAFLQHVAETDVYIEEDIHDACTRYWGKHASAA